MISLITLFLTDTEMANYVSMGSDFDSFYARFTQFILEFTLDQTAIIDADTSGFLQYKVLHPKNLTHKYNKYRCSSFVLSTDITSYNADVHDFLNLMLNIFTFNPNIGNKDDFKKIIYTYDVDFMGVIEKHNTKGWHLHLLCFYRNNYLDTKEFLSVQSEVFSKLNDIIKNIECMDQMFLNCELVKSVGSMINYLKKDPYYLISTTTELAQMYVHFQRTHIFPENSKPKYTHTKSHSLPNSTIVSFFSDKLDKGCIDYEEALQDDFAVNFLANRNLKEMFENARTHFLANRRFRNAINEIIKKNIKDPWYKKCICPINEYLKLQHIDITQWEENFVRWLRCNSKKNTITFIGPADTGKSIFLSTLHNNFRFANRLTSDGIFTFANSINADCIYHEEPFITNETAETAKLVYEGNPCTTVAVKNRSAIRLNKKIPVLISSNDHVYQYCSGQRSAFDARMYEYKTNFKMSSIKFCDDRKNITHVCSPLNVDIKRRAYKQLHGHAGEEDIWQRDSAPYPNTQNIVSDTEFLEEEVSCELVHKLKKHHWRTYIFYIITKYQMFEYYDILYGKSDIEPFEIPTVNTANAFKLPYKHNLLPANTDYKVLINETNYKNLCYLNHCYCINL